MNTFKVYESGAFLFEYMATGFVLFQPGYKIKNNTTSYTVQSIEVDTDNNCINLEVL